MDVKARTGDPLKQKTPCLVVGAFEGKTATALLKEIDTALDGSLSRAVKEKEFSGRQGETLLFHPGKRLAAERILVVGLDVVGGVVSGHVGSG